MSGSVERMIGPADPPPSTPTPPGIEGGFFYANALRFNPGRSKPECCRASDIMPLMS